jgi:hypothetical protein
LYSYSLVTGERLQRLQLGTNVITGLATENSTLYVMDSGRRLTAIDINGVDAMVRDNLILPSGGGKLFAGNGIVYATAVTHSRGGYATVNVSDPNNLVLISDVDVPAGFVAPRNAIAVNGSGLGRLVGTAAAASLDVMDVSNPHNTYSFLTRFNLDAAPSAVTIGAGIAFVASGSSGLQVINYRPCGGIHLSQQTRSFTSRFGGDERSRID